MTGNSLDMIELANALKQAGFSQSNKISILGFDACLMNMLEVAYEMSPYVQHIVGSQELEPGLGWPYTLDLNTLNTVDIETKIIIKELVDNYRNFYNQEPYMNCPTIGLLPNLH